MPKTIIFDFDGTIADSFSVFIEIYNELASGAKLEILTEERAEELRDRTPKELMKILRVGWFDIPKYLLKGRKLFKEKSNQIRPVAGISPVIHKLAKKHTLGILTSNNADIVKTFLKKYDLEVFDFVQSELNLFGKDKALKNLVKKYNLPKEEVIYIGDEVRDIESCKKIGLSIAAVSWGLNSLKVLARYRPDFLFEKPEEISTLE